MAVGDIDNNDTHFLRPDLFPIRIILEYHVKFPCLCKFPKVPAHLEYATLDHNFHPIYRDTSYLINSLLKSDRGLLRVKYDVVFFPCMFDVDFEGLHDCRA